MGAWRHSVFSLVSLLALGACTPLSTPGSGSSVQPPAWRDVASVHPNLPPGRAKWIDALASRTHKSMVREATEVGVSDPHHNLLIGATGVNDRTGHLRLHDGRRVRYAIHEVLSSSRRYFVTFTYPDGRAVVTEVEEVEEDDPIGC